MSKFYHIIIQVKIILFKAAYHSALNSYSHVQLITQLCDHSYNWLHCLSWKIRLSRIFHKNIFSMLSFITFFFFFTFFNKMLHLKLGLPWCSDDKESACNARDLGSILGWENSLKKRMQHTPVFLPGKFHGQRSQVVYSPWGYRESDMTEWLTLSLSR